MIICAGEVLADMTQQKHSDGIRFDCHAGGAPFNVACCLAKMGARCGFCGCVGNDMIGEYLIETARKQHFDYLNMRIGKKRNTTLAFVSVSDSGERKFGFYRNDTADMYLPLEQTEKIALAADIVHMGSLPLSSRRGQSFFDKLISGSHRNGKKVSFDINYRESVFDSFDAASEIYRKYIQAADILKFSYEELQMFAPGSNDEEKLRFVGGGNKIIFVTMGGDGSMVFADGEIRREKALPVKTVGDTNGAGDAFMAGALAALDAGEKDWRKILRTANACGALAVGQKGAYPEWNKDSLAAVTKQ